MSKLVRRKKEIGAALAVVLQLTTLGLIGLILPVANGPQQSAKAPADSQMSAASQAQPVRTLRAPPAGAIRAVKLYEPRATQIFHLATSRAESGRQSAQQSMREGEAPNEATLYTDRADYAPFSYVYINGSGFAPGETVNMIVVELDPVQQSFQPWDVVADENGNIATSWYISSEELIGATMEVTATGQTSGLTASATFTDSGAFSYAPTTATPSAIAGGPAVSFTQSVTAPAGNGDFTATLNVAGTGASPIPASWVSTSPTSLSFSTGNSGGPTPSPSPHTDTKSWTVSFTVPANAACGTYTAQIKADPSITGVGVGSGTAVTLTVTGCASPTPTATAASPTPTATAASPTPTPTSTPAGTNLTMAAASDTYGGTVTLSATLTSNLSPVSGKTITFTLNGNPAGSGVTNGSGVATSNTAVTLCGSSYNVSGSPYLSGAAASFAGDLDYAAASGSNSLTIAKANATVTVDAYDVTYDCLSHTVSSYTVTGVCGETGTDVGTVNVSGTTHTDAGDYTTDPWSFTGTGNYNNTSGTVHDVIAKADATVTVNPYHVTYDCTAHTSTGSAHGVCSPADDLSSLLHFPTAHTEAGDYPSDSWTFDGNTNYNATSGTVHNQIDKADATVIVNPYHVTYDCTAHTSTGSAHGVCSPADDLSSLLHLPASHTNAGDYPSDSWTFDGNTNYNATSGTVHNQIDKAHATINVTPYNVAYDMNPHTATGTASACDGDLSSLLNLSGTTHTLPGDYASDPWTFNSASTNTNYYSESGTVHDIIGYGTCTGPNGPGGQILPPINANGTSVWKVGSTVPVKFTVCDANGNPISDPYAVFGPTYPNGSLSMLSAVRGTIENVNEVTVVDVPDAQFRYSNGIWILNLATGNMTKNMTYNFRINLANGSILFTIGTK